MSPPLRRVAAALVVAGAATGATALWLLTGGPAVVGAVVVIAAVAAGGASVAVLLGSPALVGSPATVGSPLPVDGAPARPTAAPDRSQEQIAGPVAGHESAGAVADSVVNIARRTLVLLGRQLAVVDSLERGELDPDTLEVLYRLDHLATRMRRYAESLLVLIGEDTGRQARGPMPLSDVVRTAVSGIEQYSRIDVDADVDAVEDAGDADGDLLVVAHRALPTAHLLAELLDNAAASSDPATRVRVAIERTQAGARVTVADEGLGMTDAEIAAALAVVGSPGGEAATGSARLGLHVVGRLARRLGADVRIRRLEPSGLAVSVDLPAAVLVPVVAPTAVAPTAVAPMPVVQPSAVGASASGPVLPTRAPLPRRRDLRAAATDRVTGPVADPASEQMPSRVPESVPGTRAATASERDTAPPSAAPWLPVPGGFADILPAGRERRGRWRGPESPPVRGSSLPLPGPIATSPATSLATSPAASSVPFDRGPQQFTAGASSSAPGPERGDFQRRSALASEALSELSMLSAYRPESTPGASSPAVSPPLQRRTPSDVPPPVPPPTVSRTSRDPAAVGGLLAGFADGVRRGRSEPDATRPDAAEGANRPDGGSAGAAGSRSPDQTGTTPQPGPGPSGWRVRPTTEERP